MNPLVSWAVAIGFVGAASYYYSQTGKKPIPPRAAKSATASEGAPAQPKPKKEQKAKRKTEPASGAELSGSDAPFSSAREQSDLSAAEGTSKRKITKGKKQSQAQPKAQAPTAVQGKVVNNDKDDSADAAWAEQMASLRKGTNLSVPSSNAARQRTVKTSSLESNATTVASSNGAEADVDLSPVASSSHKAGDVSDMLEPRAPGPSVLRLTEPETPTPQRAPRPQKESEPAETKRQRQNKRKNEERKALVQEQEKERQALLEAQRRQAREARGEPARNGLQSAKPPQTSAWTPEKSGAPAVQPIEDVVNRAEKPAAGNAQVSIVPTEPKEIKGWTNGMSEAEAIERATRASEDESGWATVETKKGKKGHARGASDVGASQETKTQTQEPAPKKNIAAPVQPSQKIVNGFASLSTGIDAGSHPDDSEWGA